MKWTPLDIKNKILKLIQLVSGSIMYVMNHCLLWHTKTLCKGRVWVHKVFCHFWVVILFVQPQTIVEVLDFSYPCLKLGNYKWSQLGLIIHLQSILDSKRKLLSNKPSFLWKSLHSSIIQFFACLIIPQ